MGLTPSTSGTAQWVELTDAGWEPDWQVWLDFTLLCDLGQAL